MNWKSFSRAFRRVGLISVLLAGVCGFVRAQAGSAPPSTQRDTSNPYTGDLSVFDAPGRDKRLQINRVMDMLGIQPGKNVADIGAGSGWFTVRAARRVTGSGTVYAVDINPEAIRYIDQRAKKENLQNIKTILSKPDDPQLPSDSVDAVLLLKTYHEVAHPVVLLNNLRSSLKPGARIGVIDRNGNGKNHGVSKDVVVREAAQAGYKLCDEKDFVKTDGMDYFSDLHCEARIGRLSFWLALLPKISVGVILMFHIRWQYCEERHRMFAFFRTMVVGCEGLPHPQVTRSRWDRMRTRHPVSPPPTDSRLYV